MLFGYPPAAYSNNWLHEAVIFALEAIHSNIDQAKDIPPWVELLPEFCRDDLRNRPALGQRLIDYATAYRKIGSRNRIRVKRCIVEQNNIDTLLQNTSNCELLDDLPKQIRPAITSLFEYAFDLLTPLNIRDEQYRKIYEDNVRGVCPFCGIEIFDAPDGPREDLDHYLVRTKYPFAAANLRNLVPMGEKCNKKYKKTQDILRDEDGTRRIAFDPYVTPGVLVNLENSEPFGSPDGRLPKWQIDFIPSPLECDTWDAVFKIRTRYRRDVLDQKFFDWLKAFSDWFKNNRNASDIGDVNQLTEVLRDYLDVLKSLRLVGCEFLRVMVFEMLIRHCAAGNKRLQLFLRDLVMQPLSSQSQG